VLCEEVSWMIKGDVKQQQLVIKFPADIPPEAIERIEIELVEK